GWFDRVIHAAPRQLRSHAAEDGIDLEIASFDAHQWDDVGIQQHRAMPRKLGHPFGGPLADVPFGSHADISSAKRHVRFAPNSDRESDIHKQSCLLYP